VDRLVTQVSLLINRLTHLHLKQLSGQGGVIQLNLPVLL